MISIAKSFAPGKSRLQLDRELNDLFKRELCRLELENSSSTVWSQMFLNSRRRNAKVPNYIRYVQIQEELGSVQTVQIVASFSKNPKKC